MAGAAQRSVISCGSRRTFPGAHVVRLEQNYRSTPHILAAASGVIDANKGRLGKTLFTDLTEGEKVRLIGHWDGEEEARWIGDELEAMQGGTRGLRPYDLEECAILVRASHQMRAFEDRFLTIGLPYRVIGGPRFYERMEIRDAMAYFRVAVSPDDDLAFERIVNTPKRGAGDKAMQTMQRAARANGISLLEGARLAVSSGDLTGKAKGQVGHLVQQFDLWHDRVRDPKQNHIELAEQILDESGYTEMWQNDKTPEAPGRLENLKELVKALEQFENLQGFLEHVALIMDNETDDAGSKVSIMTLHAAKGLEFPAVFLPGWEDGLFPSQRSMDESGLKGLEEERRLAYVGITRAEELCTISFAANRLVYGQWQSALPSRFVDELPAEPRRRADPARALWRRLWRSGHGQHHRPARVAGKCLQLARLEAASGAVGPARDEPAERKPPHGDRPRRGVVVHAGRPGVSQQVRLRLRDGDRGRQAGYRVREGRFEEGGGEVRGRGGTRGRRAVLTAARSRRIRQGNPRRDRSLTVSSGGN